MFSKLAIASTLLLSSVALAHGDSERPSDREIHESSYVTGHIRPADMPTVDTTQLFREVILENETARWVRVEVDGRVITWLAPGERDVARVQLNARVIKSFVDEVEIGSDLVSRGTARRQLIEIERPRQGTVTVRNTRHEEVYLLIDGQWMATLSPGELGTFTVGVGGRDVRIVSSRRNRGRHRRVLLDERISVSGYEVVKVSVPDHRVGRRPR